MRISTCPSGLPKTVSCSMLSLLRHVVFCLVMLNVRRDWELLRLMLCWCYQAVRVVAFTATHCVHMHDAVKFLKDEEAEVGCQRCRISCSMHLRRVARVIPTTSTEVLSDHDINNAMTVT